LTGNNASYAASACGEGFLRIPITARELPTGAKAQANLRTPRREINGSIYPKTKKTRISRCSVKSVAYFPQLSL
jgi:hypothetical protein